MRSYTFDKSKNCSKAIYTIVLLAFAHAVPLAVLSMPAQADDDIEVEVICWDDVHGETQCETVENLKAECELSDPEGTNDICAQVLDPIVREQPGDLIIDSPNRGNPIIDSPTRR